MYLHFIDYELWENIQVEVGEINGMKKFRFAMHEITAQICAYVYTSVCKCV